MPIHIQDPNRQPVKKMVIGDGSLERQQIAKNKSVESETSRSKEQSRRMEVVENDSREKHESNNMNQQQKRKTSGNDISRAKDQPRKMVVAEDESRARQQSARKKTKISPLCRSMLIGDFLKENGIDVEKEMENLIEEEENIVLEEQEQEENVDCEEDRETNGTTKKRTRGPTRCLKIYARPVKDRQEVTLDDFGEAVGPDNQTVTGLAYFLGTIARNADFCPLIYTNFKKLLKDETNPKRHNYRIWKYINTKFNIPERGRKGIYYRINDAWRRYKHSIKVNHFLKYSNMKDRLKNRPKSISEDHFTKLLAFWKSDHIQEISKKNAVNRSKQKFMHRVGPTNFARIRAKLRENKDGQEVTQAEMFIETRKSRKGKQVDEETQFAIDKLQESIEKSTEVGTQTFQSLFGKEKPSRVRCYGRTVTPSLLKKNEEISLMKMQYDGKICDMTQKMGAMEALLKSMYMQQNSHLSEEEVNEKMREVLHNDNIPTPRSSTSTYAPTHQKVRNGDDPDQDEQDEDLHNDDLQYDQDDDDLQYADDEDLQYDEDDEDLQHDEDDEDLLCDNFQDDDSHDPQPNLRDEDHH
ncbi:uncharacterized protein LOC131617414 [Vicia villosa]|uniref:uncharacterized protein LOC131617414 n=1 Tax=Vicia villosa TaxID=3911 RepID=UPI00273B4A01|nr:uncharacterized protein LOC131617414 [Vicia villosa]